MQQRAVNLIESYNIIKLRGDLKLEMNMSCEFIFSKIGLSFFRPNVAPPGKATK